MSKYHQPNLQLTLRIQEMCSPPKISSVDNLIVRNPTICFAHARVISVSSLNWYPLQCCLRQHLASGRSPDTYPGQPCLYPETRTRTGLAGSGDSKKLVLLPSSNVQLVLGYFTKRKGAKLSFWLNNLVANRNFSSLSDELL